MTRPSWRRRNTTGSRRLRFKHLRLGQTSEGFLPKGLVVSRDGKVSSFQLEKLERAKLYGVRRRLAVDEKGRTCSRASLTDDGQVLLRSGMMAQGWFDTDGRQVEQKAIGAEDEDGKALELVPSTLGLEQVLDRKSVV